MKQLTKSRLWFFFIIVVAIGVIISLSGRGKSSSLNILVAPSGSTVKLDGKGVRTGISRVKQGEHSVLVSKKGFKSQQQTVNVGAKQTKFVGIILSSNSPATANWYSSHDQDLVQTINNQAFDQTSKDVVTSNPLLTKLPYVGPGSHFRIDYGVASAQSKSGAPAIYIRYDSDGSKTDAIKWVTRQGFDINKLDIVYISVPPNSLQ